LADQPGSTLAAFTGARVLAALGERPRAEEWAERVLRLGPKDHLTLFLRAAGTARGGGRVAGAGDGE
jgi:hypothetical protein